MEAQVNKQHNAPSAGKKAEKKKQKKQAKHEGEGPRKNPRAQLRQTSIGKIKEMRRTLDRENRRLHIPKVEKVLKEPPPVLVAVVGPAQVGKSTLIRSLVRHYTKQNIKEIKGPITVVSGKRRRITFVECPNDLGSMMDVAKVADLVLLLIDGHFGFEMETFEFLNVLQVHGFPKVMGVLTHLDKFKKASVLKKTKKQLKTRFWTEIYQGAKLFYLSGMEYEKWYPRNEVFNIARYLSIIKFRPLQWRSSHSHFIADRMEDLTYPQLVQDDITCDRTVALYGYVRGTNLKPDCKVHIPGCGDFRVTALTQLNDPCPMPEIEEEVKGEDGQPKKIRRKTLNSRDKLLYAPMGDIGDITVDRDATYIHIPDNKVSFTEQEGVPEIEGPGESMVRTLQKTTTGIDEKLASSSISLFESSAPIKGSRTRRPAHEESDGDSDESKQENRETGSDFSSDDGSSSDEDEDEDDDEDEDEEGDGEPEFDFLSRSLNALRRAPNLSEVIYGTALKPKTRNLNCRRHEGSTVVTPQLPSEFVSYEDSTTAHLVGARKMWEEDEDEMEILRKRFADSSWFDELQDDSDEEGGGTGRSVNQGVNMEVDGSDDELFGDFEDLETGESFGAATAAPSDRSSDEESEGEGDEESDEESDVDTTEVERLKRKAELKAQFDASYDDDGEGGNMFEVMKESLSKQEEMDRLEFVGEDANLQAQYRGFLPGAYVRAEIVGLPCEFVEHFNPKYPVIVGSLLPTEEQLGMIQARIKRHRWHRKILKTRDPLIISLGWRRFQTVPLYSLADDNLRHRMLKYTPEHMHCYVTFYGPLTPPNTGFVAFQSLSNAIGGFRVSATGVILELDKKFKLVKKLKLTGTPMKIHKNTAFIRGMFNNRLEVAKFEGGAIRTVSGIRGQIKKAAKTPEGAFRATFEDKILKSDIVFLRAWVPVEPVEFYNPVTTLLQEHKDRFEGMKTVFQLRKEANLAIPVKKDSLYKPIERETRRFNSLKIPKTLERDLPFSSKPKTLKKRSKPTYETRRAVVMNKKEKAISTLIQEAQTMKKDKLRTRAAKQKERKETMLKKRSAEEALRNDRARAARKEVFRKQGLQEKNASLAKRRKVSADD